MKYLTITVPCFNSEKYLKRCLDSLTAGGDDVEIIVVNDGSTDRTGEIAERYARWFPEIVTVVHKENGGYGSGVNIGLRLANYMCRNISIMMAISSIHLLLSGEERAKSRHREIWADMKQDNPGLYYRFRYTKLSGLTNLPGKLGKKAAVDGYRIAKKIYKFQ